MGGRTGNRSAGGRGSIGREIFDHVEQLTANGTMTKLDAFKQLSSASGRQLGTVAANYYRIARRSGVALQPRRRRAAVAGSRSKGAVAGLLRSVEQLAAVVAALEHDVATLRKENRRIAELRRLLSV